MSRGGKREGAGRPQGSTTKRTRRIVEQHEAKRGSMLPLDVMLTAMQRHADSDEWPEAAKIAALAAPYCHPKLATIEHSGPGGGPIETKEHTGMDRAKALAAVLAASQS